MRRSAEWVLNTFPWLATPLNVLLAVFYVVVTVVRRGR